MKTSPLLKTPLSFLRLSVLAAIVSSVVAPLGATSVLINFSSAPGNDINAPVAGVDLANILNVRTNSTSYNTAVAIGPIQDITGTAFHSDYFQQSQNAYLGQPYATLIGAYPWAQGATDQVVISLDLGDWLANGSYSFYEVTVYVAGRDANTWDLVTAPEFSEGFKFTDGVITEYGSLTSDVVHTDSGYWGAYTQAIELNGSDFTFSMAALGNNIQTGVAAIKITGISAIPEPSTALLGGLAALALLRRRA